LLEKVSTPAPVLVAFFDKERLNDYLQIAAVVRRGGIGVELFPDAKKLGQQLQYADKRGFKIALIAGSRELDAGIVQVKNLATTQTEEVPLELTAAEPGAALLATLRRLLG
jgi:histidyl-tRNA synthetase